MLIQKQVPKQNPKKLLLMGLPKIGKSTVTSQLQDSVIMDFEDGFDYIAHPAVAHIKTVPDLRLFQKEVTEIQKSSKPYRFGVMDTVSSLERQLNQYIAGDHGVTAIEEIAYGAGYGVLRAKLLTVLDSMSSLFEHLVILGHLKKKYIERNNGKLDTEFEIELTGKLASIFMAQMDAIGLLYREDGEVWCKFLEANEDNEVIIGSRLSSLDGKTIQLTKKDEKGYPVADWSQIYK